MAIAQCTGPTANGCRLDACNAAPAADSNAAGAAVAESVTADVMFGIACCDYSDGRRDAHHSDHVERRSANDMRGFGTASADDIYSTTSTTTTIATSTAQTNVSESDTRGESALYIAAGCAAVFINGQHAATVYGGDSLHAITGHPLVYGDVVTVIARGGAVLLVATTSLGVDYATGVATMRGVRAFSSGGLEDSEWMMTAEDPQHCLAWPTVTAVDDGTGARLLQPLRNGSTPSFQGFPFNAGAAEVWVDGVPLGDEVFMRLVVGTADGCTTDDEAASSSRTAAALRGPLLRGRLLSSRQEQLRLMASEVGRMRKQVDQLWKDISNR